jgi:hypothetical protein
VRPASQRRTDPEATRAQRSPTNDPDPRAGDGSGPPRGTSDATIVALAGAIAGRGPTLGDVEPLRAVAGALDDAGVHSAALSDTAVSPRPPIDLDPEVSLPDQPTLAPYEAYGVGTVLADTGPELVVVLVHADEDGATENRERLAAVVEGAATGDGRPWTDVLADPRTTHDGRTVVARFDVESPRVWLGILLRADPLLAVG